MAKKTRRKVSTAKKVRPGAAIRVRMYRQGLGDCFLIAIPKSDGTPFYLMIDCGVILGTADAETKMKAVVADIAKTTAGHVDLLLATHEHWDHLSGFVQARELFAIEIDHPILKNAEAHVVTRVGRKLSLAANKLLQLMTSQMRAFR